MKGGDTLVIRDGVYRGAVAGGPEFLPPSGTATAYTVIRAEHPGQVTFDGNGVNATFAVRNSAANLHHVEFHCLKWVNTWGGIAVYLRGDQGSGAARCPTSSSSGAAAWEASRFCTAATSCSKNAMRGARRATCFKWRIGRIPHAEGHSPPMCGPSR